MNGDPGWFRPLTELRVLEIGDGVAGAATTAILASLGAEVTTMGRAASSLRTTPPSADTAEGTGRSLLSAILDRDKSVDFAGDPAELLAASSFDIVVCDRVAGPVPGLPVDVDEYLRAVERTNTGVWVTISGFGLVGPRRSEEATDFVIAAAGGMLSVVTDPDTDRPVELAGSQMLLSAGQAAALAACHGSSRRREGEMPVHVDVSAQAVAVATGPVMKVLGLLLDSAAITEGRKYGAPAAFYPCRDGLLRISALEDHQWRGVTEAFERPDWLRRFPSPADRIDNVEEIDALITDLTLPLGKAECEAVLQARGVPAAAMYGPAELLESDQFAFRSAIVRHSVDGMEIRTLGPAFAVDRGAPDDDPASVVTPVDESGATSETTPRAGLAGLRVAEVGHVLAVPLAGSLLGAMGADVVKLEDTGRIDIFRRKAPYVDDIAGLERAVYFSMVNHSKRSVAMGFEKDADTLAAIVGHSDVVIDNLGPSRTAKLGLGAALRADHPDVLVVSSSAYGHRGPWARYRAYAYNIHAGSGLLALSRTPSGEPAHLAMAWADVITGYAIATVVAAWAVGRRAGAALDLSMAELIGARFNEFLAAESAGISHSSAAGSASVLVDTAAGLIATTVADEAQREALERQGHEHEATEVVLAELHRLGFPAAVVADASALVVDEQLDAFGLFPEVVHPEWGRRRMVGLPWRIVGEPVVSLQPPPCLGEHDVEPEPGSGDPDPWPTRSNRGT